MNALKAGPKMWVFGKGKLFGQFGSPRSILAMAGVCIQLALIAYFIGLAVEYSPLFWYAVAAWLAPITMWIVFLDAHRSDEKAG